jgi:hypothetical protein
MHRRIGPSRTPSESSKELCEGADYSDFPQGRKQGGRRPPVRHPAIMEELDARILEVLNPGYPGEGMAHTGFRY